MAEKATDPLDFINDKLTEYEEKLSKERDAHLMQIRDIDATLKQVRAKLKAGRAIDGESVPKPAATKADTIAAAISVLESKGPLSEAELKELVSKRLRATHSLSGFALRFRETMQSDLFVADQSGIRLSGQNRVLERLIPQ